MTSTSVYSCPCRALSLKQIYDTARIAVKHGGGVGSPFCGNAKADGSAAKTVPSAIYESAWRCPLIVATLRGWTDGTGVAVYKCAGLLVLVGNSNGKSCGRLPNLPRCDNLLADPWGPGSDSPPPFVPRCRLFNIGPKARPPPPLREDQ